MHDTGLEEDIIDAGGASCSNAQRSEIGQG